MPLSMGQILDDGFRLFRASFAKVLPLVLITATSSAVFAFVQRPVPGESLITFRAIVAGIAGGSIALFLVIAQIAMIGAVAAGRDLTVGDALAVAVSRFIPAIIASVLFLLAMVIGTIFLVVPAIILSVTLSMWVYAIVLDGRSAVASLRYSHELVWGNWWRTATALSVAVVMVIVVYMLAMLAGGVLFGIADANQPEEVALFANVGGAMLGAFVNPFLYALGLAIYHDLKVRREGADIEARLLAVQQGV